MEQITTEQVRPKPARPEVVIRIKNASVRFNMAGEKVDNLKEFFIKLRANRGR